MKRKANTIGIMRLLSRFPDEQSVVVYLEALPVGVCPCMPDAELAK